jgi:hypothetical protein
MDGAKVGGLAVKQNTRFQEQVVGRLISVGRRLRAYAVAAGAASVMVFLLLAASGQLALDYALRLPLDMRAALLGVIVLSACYLIYARIWVPLQFSYGPREMAKLVERRHPQLKSVLVSSVEFAAGEIGSQESNSPELAALVLDEACRDAQSVRFRSVLRHGRARNALLTVIVVLGCCVSAFAAKPEFMSLWFERNVLLGDAEWPKRTRLVLDASSRDLTGARGDDLEIRAHAVGEVPREVDVIFEYLSGKSGRETMVAVGERGFRYTFVRVQEAFRFRLVGGDDATDWYDATLAERPRVQEVTISVTPPGYTGVDSFTLPAGQRAVEVLKGAEVTLDVQLNKPAVRADLMSGQDLVATASGAGSSWSLTMSPDVTRTYHFALEDEIGLENKRPVRFSVRVLKDAAPRVRLKVPGVSDMITPQAILPLEVSVSDTYGIARAELVHQVVREGYEPESSELDGFKAGMTKFDVRLHWPAATVAPVAGDRVVLFATAADYDDVSGPNESNSSAVSFRVVTGEELLSELARREHEYRQEFERVIEQQEELRSQLLSLVRRIRGSDESLDLVSRANSLERRQRQITGQVNLIRQQFEQIMTEFEINGLDLSGVHERLAEGVIEPLSQLAKRDLVDAADALRRISRSDDASTAATAADDLQRAVLGRMRRILANMLKWEGYHEAVTMLRDIVRLQTELNRETREELERRAADILGP